MSRREYSARSGDALSESEALEAKARRLYPQLGNRAMARKLADGQAVDVAEVGTVEERNAAGVATVWRLPPQFFFEHHDYCHVPTEDWIWSIGRRKSDGAIFCALDARYYQSETFTCLWLR